MNGEEAIEKSISVIKEALQLAVDWNESKETINDILNDILSFRKISTNAFQKIEIRV